MAYIKIDRGFFDGKYWKQKRVFSQAEAWIDLVRMARFEVEPETRLLPNNRRISIGRGEIHASVRFLAERWLWGNGRVKRFIDAAISEHAMERRTEQGESIIKLSNYDSYNQVNDYNGTPIDTLTDTLMNTVIDTVTDTPAEQIKEYKEYKEYKKYILSEINPDDFPDINKEYIEITKAFQSLFRENLLEAGASTKTIDKAKGTWIDSIRLMIEVDGYTVNDLREVYQLLQKDAFWKQNILSTAKLREKMDKLKLKLKNGNGNKREATSWTELAEVISALGD